ncbi:PREDICTED: uncharacterized protein LOC106910534 [Poecilia mexicana]|uniref:uncharacterized protein LOC106910534 n=1 Tax=Poecilia mexicana TaxID=48701 RepID=UPI00072E7B9D|nr:PREDICTED: uncharacterized protein LOC106910534 [Poecilia mexicana]XP_014832681.1 PREDICTED: uncharacterized protein LOC106910534 [Poecilia mexicana]XP_014832682.1 PREDICTED: uncharacterized protein LOC106910534 [Poecilia mexicana]XP_014832683.1 PREDICTED: uncharacterized protein LOC106910534 [Poecilia mexicana]
MSSPSEQSQVISTQTVKPAVDCFFSDLSPEQWMSLASGTPDQSTNCKLTQLLGDTMELFVASVLEKVQREEFTCEIVEDVVGNIITEAFTQSMKIKHEVRTENTENLNRLIVEYVTERVKSKFPSDDEDSAESYIQKISDMYRKDAVVRKATAVIRELFSLMCKSLPRSKRIPLFLLVDKQRVKSARKVSLKSCPGNQADCGKQDSSAQPEAPSDGSDELRIHSQASSPATKPKSKVKGLKRKIKKFFTKCFHRRSSTVTPSSVPESPEEKSSAHTFLGGWSTPADNVSDVSPTDRSSPVDQEENIPYLEKSTFEGEGSEVTSVREFISDDQPAKITQIENLQPQLNDYVKEVCPAAESIMPETLSYVPSFEEMQELAADLQEQGKKTVVSILVHELIAQLIKASDGNIAISFSDSKATHRRLVDKIWAEVQKEDVHIDLERALKLDKKIYSSICKALRCPGDLRALLLFETATFDSAVVSCFLKHLVRSVEKPFLSQFFSAVGEAISKLFRQPGADCEEFIPSEDDSSGNNAAEDEVWSDSEQDSDSTARKPEDIDWWPMTPMVPMSDSQQQENLQETEEGEEKEFSFSSSDFLTETSTSVEETEVSEKELAVKILIGELVWKIVEKSGQCYPRQQYHTVCERLSQNLWAQVKASLDNLSPEKIKSLDRVIYNDLCKRWDHPESLLVLLDLGQPPMDQIILSCIRKRLLNPSRCLVS